MAKTTADVTLVKGAAAMGEAAMPADLSGLDKISLKTTMDSLQNNFLE